MYDVQIKIERFKMKVGDNVKMLDESSGVVKDIFYSKLSKKPFKALITRSDTIDKVYYICDVEVVEND